MSEALFVCKFR